MKNFKQLVMLFLVATVSLTSCNKDDNNDASIEGKWEYSQETNDEGNLVAYEHSSGCDKDYTEFIAGGVFRDVYFYKDLDLNCVQENFNATWSRSGSTITVTNSGDTYTSQILELTDTTLKIKSVDGTDEYITVYTRR